MEIAVSTTEAETATEVKVEAPAEEDVTTTEGCSSMVVVDAVARTRAGSNNLLLRILSNSGNNNNMHHGLLLHLRILLIGLGPMLAQKLSKQEFLEIGHNLLPLLQLGQAQQILKLLFTLSILLNLTHHGTWTLEQHLI